MYPGMDLVHSGGSSLNLGVIWCYLVVHLSQCQRMYLNLTVLGCSRSDI